MFKCYVFLPILFNYQFYKLLRAFRQVYSSSVSFKQNVTQLDYYYICFLSDEVFQRFEEEFGQNELFALNNFFYALNLLILRDYYIINIYH